VKILVVGVDRAVPGFLPALAESSRPLQRASAGARLLEIVPTSIRGMSFACETAPPGVSARGAAIIRGQPRESGYLS
jgi:hypothetical protein